MANLIPNPQLVQRQVESATAPPVAAVTLTVGGKPLAFTYTSGASLLRISNRVFAVGPSITSTIVISTDTLVYNGGELEINATPVPFAPLETGTGDAGLAEGTASGQLGRASSTTAAFSSNTAMQSAAPTTRASSASPSSTSIASTSGDSSRSSWLSPGAAAGLAIGCLIAGALIALVTVFFLLRRSKRKDAAARAHESGPDPFTAIRNLNDRYAETKNAAVTTTSPSEHSVLFAPVLARRRTDDSISGAGAAEDVLLQSEAHQLHTKIHAHVRTYYSATKSLQIPEEFFDFSSLGPGSMRIGSAKLAVLLSTLDSRFAAIHFCIAWAVVSRLGLEGGAVEQTLLPVEMAVCLQMLKSQHVNNDEGVLLRSF